MYGSRSQAILKITDGTASTAANLLASGFGAHLMEWSRNLPDVKDGGTWQSSPFTPGSQKVAQQYDDIIDTIRITINEGCQDDVIAELRRLIAILIAADQYWLTDSNTTPVYIMTRAYTETKIGYAIIKEWRIPQIGDAYHQPFGNLISKISTLDTFDLIIRHGIWMDNPPDGDECVELSSQSDALIPTEAIYMPAQSTDDAYVDHDFIAPPYIDTSGNDLVTGFEVILPSEDYDLGIRFRNVNIAQGETITAAYIALQAYANDASTCTTIIYGEDNSSPAAFSTYADFAGRTLTTANVTWNIPSITAGTRYTSPDIKTIIQEIVDRPDWVSGGDIVIFVQAQHDGNPKRFNSWDRWNATGTTDRPELLITYEDEATLGPVATCDDELFMKSSQTYTQLSHVFLYDGAAYGGNLLATPLPYNILEAGMLVTSAIYFGVEDGRYPSNYWAGIAFSLTVAQTGYSLTWEYWNGAAWAALTTIDNTNNDGNIVVAGQPFDTVGDKYMSFIPPIAWAKTIINAVDAWWVRARVTAVAGGTAATVDYHPYSVVNAFAELDGSEVGGDIPALARIKLIAQNEIIGPAPYYGMARIWYGLRSKDRGANFTPFINMSQTENPSGLTVSATAPNAAFQTDYFAACGESITYASGGASADFPAAVISFSEDLIREYYGKFKVFLRLKSTRDDITVRLGYSLGAVGGYLYTQYKSLESGSSTVQVQIDFDSVEFPVGGIPYNLSYKSQYSNRIIVFITATAATTVELYDLVLLPIDENAVLTFSTKQDVFQNHLGRGDAGVADTGRRYLELNSTNFPKYEPVVSLIRFEDDDLVATPWLVAANNNMILQPNEDQRFWFLPELWYNGLWRATQREVVSAQAFRNARYLSMLGTG